MHYMVYLQGMKRAAGHYPYQVCFGAFDPTLEDFDRRRVIHSLPFAHVILTGLLEDEDGGMSTYMRSIECHSSAFTMVFDRRPGEDFGVFHPSMRQFFRGTGAYAKHEDKVRFISMNEDGLLGMRVDAGPAMLELEEPGLAALTGRRIGPGFNFFAPQANDDIYRSIVAYDVSGDFLGRRVKGFLSWQMVHAMPGEHWGYARIVPKVIYAWAMGLNRYEDGERELVHISAGRHGWGFLTALDEKGVTASARIVDCDLDFDEEGYPKRVYFRTEAGDWEWSGNPADRFAPSRQIKVPYTYGVGVLKRVGERRALGPNSLTGMQTNPKTWTSRRPLSREAIKERLMNAQLGADLFSHDAVIWQNLGGGKTMTLDELSGALAGVMSAIKGIRFEDGIAHDTSDGVVVRRINVVTLQDGAEIRAPVCLVARIAEGKITRLEEYLSESRMARLFTSLSGANAN
jgi:ketosteroid isomerase-like protein